MRKKILKPLFISISVLMVLTVGCSLPDRSQSTAEEELTNFDFRDARGERCSLADLANGPTVLVFDTYL